LAGGFSPGVSFGGDWRQLAAGLDVAEFSHGGESRHALVVVRIDPARRKLVVLSKKELPNEKSMSVHQWMKKYTLLAAINAGMFAQDYETHLGYMRIDGKIHSGKLTAYKSVAAFSPKQKGIAAFHIFDLDDHKDWATIKNQYNTLIQNLRLIKRPAANRWKHKPKRWSEAALGEDKEGRVLFIFSRQPYTMHDFNEKLIALPIHIHAAQHLEGGPEAQLTISVDGYERLHVEHSI